MYPKAGILGDVRVDDPTTALEALRGISAEQSFPATIVPTEEGRIAAEAHFDIDRTRWGAIYGSAKFFEHLGMHLVFDQISLQLRIITRSTRKGLNHERQHPA